MKLKYFLRGVGVGIIFGALIMLVAYLTTGASKLSDEEIIKRAENLGMVQEEDLVITGTKEDTTESTEDASAQSADGNDTTEATFADGTTEDIIQDSDVSIEGVVDGTINSSTTEASTEGTSTDASTESADDTYVTASISVTSGMTSTEVALLLQEVGIIEDYEDFDAFLNENGYSTQIKINDYDFNSNMTYQELAEALIKEDKIEE